MTLPAAALSSVIWKWELIISILGLAWRSSGQDSTLLQQRVQVRSLVGELRAIHHTAPAKCKTSKYISIFTVASFIPEVISLYL